MNIPPSEAKALSLREYEGILWNWNKTHSTGEVEPPDPDKTQRLIDKINTNPNLSEAKGRKEPMRAGPA